MRKAEDGPYDASNECTIYGVDTDKLNLQTQNVP